MRLEDVMKEWEADGQFDFHDLVGENLKSPRLHAKYQRMYTEEVLKLKGLRADLKRLQRVKSEYFRGDLEPEELKRLGWKPFPRKVLKSDVSTHVETDDDVIGLSLRIGVQEEKVQYLESVVREIRQRSFHLKNILEFQKFMAGN